MSPYILVYDFDQQHSIVLFDFVLCLYLALGFHWWSHLQSLDFSFQLATFQQPLVPNDFLWGKHLMLELVEASFRSLVLEMDQDLDPCLREVTLVLGNSLNFKGFKA